MSKWLGWFLVVGGLVTLQAPEAGASRGTCAKKCQTQGKERRATCARFTKAGQRCKAFTAYGKKICLAPKAPARRMRCNWMRFQEGKTCKTKRDREQKRCKAYLRGCVKRAQGYCQWRCKGKAGAACLSGCLSFRKKHCSRRIQRCHRRILGHFNACTKRVVGLHKGCIKASPSKRTCVQWASKKAFSCKSNNTNRYRKCALLALAFRKRCHQKCQK